MLIMFTAGVNELLLLVVVLFIETGAKAPRQGLISRRRPGLGGSNHSTSVMAFGAEGGENRGLPSGAQRCGQPPALQRPRGRRWGCGGPAGRASLRGGSGAGGAAAARRQPGRG